MSKIETLHLRRVYHRQTTFGEIWYKETLMSYAIELPWRNNARRASCIPEGDYQLGRHQSGKFGLCPVVRDVPGRSAILIHAANDADDTDGSADLLGCIAPVTWVRVGNGTLRGLESKAATKIINSLIFDLIEKGGCHLWISALNMAK